MKSYVQEAVIISIFLFIAFLSGFLIFRASVNSASKTINTSLSGISNTIGHFSNIGQYGASTGVLVTTSSAQVVATSSSREYAEIANLSSFAIYCNMDDDKAAVLYQGITIFASSTKVLGQDFSYTGAVRCISTGNASTTVYVRQ